MFDEQDRQYFYNEFKENGYEVGSYDDFKKDLNNKEDRDWYYNEAKNMGYDVGTLEDFDKMVLEPAPSTSGGAQQVAASTTPQSVGQNASTETKPQVAQPAAQPAAEKPKEDNRSWFTKWMTGSLPEEEKPETADKEPGLIAKALGMIPTGVQTSNGTYQPSPAISQPVVKGEEKPVKEEASPSSSSANAASPESKEAAPVTTPTSVVNNEGLMDAKLANYLENWKQRPDKQGDYFENMVADLLADGTANSNEEAVKMVQSALGRYANRSAMDVTNQVVSSLPDDTVQDTEQSIEAQWYSHGVQDKLKQEADSMGISYDDYVAQFLKPAMVQSLVNKYGPNYRNIAEGIATRLYAHDEHVQDRLMNQDINEALSGVISKYVNPSVVDEYKKAQEAGSKAFTEGMEGSQFIPANLRLGTALGAQYEANEAKDPAKVLSGLQNMFSKLYRNPKFLNDMSNAAFKVMQRYGMNGTLSSDPKQFKPMINSVLKNELDQLEIKGMMPKGSAEYIMKAGLGNTIVGKIIRKAVQTDYQNWLEDIANQQYQPGFWENVASGALTFAGDAWSYWLPGAAGGKLTKSMLAKAEGRLAGDLMAKGMESRMAARAAKLLIGKSKTEALKSGAVHGAVTFGGQSAISKPIDEKYRTGQFDENGKIYNPSGWKIALDTLLEGGKQGALGVIMQGNTIANMIGKGRGLATNILADVGGKVADSGIMTGHQMLERMAQDPNFKPTGKDAAESFLESMANLTAIGLPGMVGKYARFKDAREFNKKFDFTDQDIAELKRFGYEDLRDAFEKVGIGEYAVEGENAQRLDGQLTQKYMNLMNDKSVPEVLKAKMMAVVEGKRPSSFSPVVDSVIVQPMDNGGKVYLETLNKDGGIIERKEYSSLDEAQKADKKLEYEKTLGLASVLESEFHNEFTQEHLDGLYNQAAQKYNMGEKLTDEDKAAVYLHQNAGAIKDIMDKQQKGIILTEEEQKQVDTYRHFYNSALENSSVMREFVNTFEDSHGVARGTLRTALESKDKKYAPLVESYLKELYNSIELKREMKQTMDDLYNTAHGNEQKRIEQSGIEGEKPAAPVEGAASVEGAAPVEGTSSVEESTGGQEPPVSAGPAPYQDRTNSVPSPSDANSAANSAVEVASSEPKVATSDAFVMGQEAYKNGDSGNLQAIGYNSDLATGRLNRAFADSDTMFDLVTKAYNEGRDMEQFVAQRAGNLTPAQKEAISKYVEAMDAKKGAIDALQHADDGYGDALKEQLWPYQTEDGNIVPATLTSGKQVFLKKANEYGGGFVVVPDEQGQPTIKQVSNAEIKEVGTPVSLDEYIEKAVAQQKDARNKQFISQFDGSGLKRGDIVSVSMEEGDEPSDVKIVGYTDDGHVILTDTDIDVNAQIDPKKLESVTKDKFNAWRQNALNVSIGAELDAEDAQRANDDAAKAEADKKQRYANGIVGLSEGQPDYSSKDTDTKVAADYLQEQYGEDHGKLLNLVNGSRDDIKTQLDNKKKAAAEYQNWLDTNADLDPEKAKKVEDELSLVNEQIADLDARFKNWNTIRNSVMTPDEVKAMTEERKAEVEKAGVDETAIVPSDDFHVLVLDDKELKKQYPTMDKASDYITSQRKDIYHTQEDVEHKLNDVNDMLEQYINGETELDPTQLMELNTTKAQLEALQTNLSVAAKGLKAQANKLSKLYKTEVSQQEMEELGMTPSEQRKVLVSDAIKKNDLGAIKEIYKDASVDVTDLTPQTLEEAVSESLSPHSLNPESLQYELGKSNFKFGIGKRYDSNKFNYLIAKKGTGMSVNEFAVRVYNDLPVNLQDMGYTDQDVRNALLDMFKSYDSVKEMRNVALMNRIAAAEDELSSEEEFYEAQKERENIERQAEIEKYKSFIHEKELSLPSESELDHIYGLEYDRMMEIEDREREYKQYVKSILPELADYDDRSNDKGYGGGSSLGSDSSRRGVDEGNSQGKEVGNGEASSESEIGEGSDSGRKGRQETGSLERGEGSTVRGSHLPQEASFGERLKSAISETETEPTEAQKKAGNYKKGHLSFGGYDYTVETPKGVTRSGKDEQGKPWSVTMHDTYGYILGKIGVDGDHIDMFINDAADLDSFDGNVYVVDQVNPETGEFDEHKVMYGYPSEEAATEAYLANYSKGWKGLGKVTSVPKAIFDKWLESSDRKTKPFREYAMIQHEEAKKAKESNEALPFDAPMNMDDLPFHRDVKEVKPSDMTEAQKVAYDAVSTMLKKAGIPVKVVSNEDMEKVAEAQDNLNLAMLLNQPEMRFKIKTPEEKKAAENAYNFAKDLRPNKWAQYAVVDMSNPNKMPEYYQKQELARKERTYLNRLMWGNYKVFNLDKSFEDNVAGLTGSFPSEFDPYKIDEQTSKKNELKKQIKETEEAYKLTGQERKEYQNQLMKEYMDEHGLASENDIPDDVWREFDYKAIEKYQDKLDSLFAKYKDLDRQLKAVAEPGVRFLRTYHGTGASFSEFDFDHIGEGEGSQAFGWGGYVTSSKKIGKNYATLMDNDPSRAYYRIQHSNGTRFAKKYPTLESFLHGDKQIAMNDKFTEQEKIDYYNEMKKLAEPYHNLYEVDIPDDNGSNYLDWDAPLTDKQKNTIIKELRRLKIDFADFKKRGFSFDGSFGGNSYDFLMYALRKTKKWKDVNASRAVSKFLSSLGYTGIKYKAGRNFGGAEEGDTNYVIFKPEDMKIVDRTKFAQNKGVVYGYTDGKEIVLNQEHLNPNTPIHEYQHLWRTAAKEMNPELIAHGDELIKQTQLFRDLKEDPNYKHLSDDEICDEAFARLTGEDGAAILEQMAKDAIKENPLDTAKELTIINRLKNWLKKFWYWTLNTFTKWKPEDIKKMTLEDIRNLVLRDLANGVDPRTVMNEKKEGAKLSNKEKDDATERIDKRIAELNRQEKEQSLKSENGNLAESHDNGYLPSKDNLDGVQSVAPSSAKIDKKFPTKTFYLGNLANFITSMGKNADITAGNFTKKLFEGMGMTPHGKDTQVSEYFKYQTDDGGKTTVRLSDHSGNALSIIKKGGRADKGYSIVVRVDSSPKTKFKANKYSNVAEYVYENPNADGLKDIARSVFNLIDTGEYLDLAGANEVHVSPRNNDADKTLVGVHNITEEKLRKALKLGGLANPSLAVIDTSKSAHDNFGEISFIAPSALVDKRTGKTGGTWITDAYTQRYPSVEREMSEKGYRKFEDWVDSLEYPAADKAEIKRQAEDALSNNNAPAWELMYLKEKGIDIKEYDSRIDYRWKEIIRDHPTAEDILSSMQNDPELNEKVKGLAKHIIVDPIRGKISLEVRRKIYEETGVKMSSLNPQVRKQTKEIFERDYKPTLLDKDGKPKDEDIKKVVEDIVKEHNDTKKYDFYLSKVKASNYVNKNGLYDDYIRWQENKLDEFGTKNRIFRGYTKDGSRKYVPETLENVSKAMREDANGQTNGSEYTSFGSFIAKLASRVDSTDEMRANKDKLSSNKDKEEFYEKWESVYYDLAKSLYNDVFYGEQRLHDIVSQPDPKKYAKKEYGITLTPSFMKKLDSLKNAVQNELKSAYFETKFNRPVHLNEFVAAVVPNNLGEDVRKGLEESGLSLYDYDPEKEGDRKRAFNEAINSNNEIRFHRVTEPEELERLNKEKTFRMYSGMQEVDGKLYSPMAAIIDGKRTDATEIGAWMGADERPDLVKGGKFQLVKTDKNPGAGEGPVRAAYNPYMHTSTSMMNDQFTGAYARGNIKVVEWEIPESEKTSGYRAEGAKDAVGLVPWHSGSVNGLLPKDRQRSVMLSRWRKAVRVVPDSEVAESIAEQLEGTGLAIPWNVVTPNQVRELVKLGVPITTVESGQQAPETKEKFMAQMEELKKEFPQAQFVDVKMTKDAFKEWGGKGLVQSPILEQKLQKHPDSLMKAGTYFSGGGLVEEGLKGIIDPVVAVEYDRKISGVYRNNFGQHIVTADVRDVDPKELVKHIDGEVEYFHASPVCKNYSQAKSNGGEVELDKETAKSTADFINAVKPRVVTIENVKGYKDSEAMKIITQALDKNGYTWDADVYNAADFGGYTSRERLIVRAVKDGELPEKPKKQPRKSGWLEAVEDILPTLKVKESGVAPWMDARLKADGIDWQKVEKPLYVMGSAYADGKIPHAYGDEILPTLRTKSGDVIIMPGGKVLRADGRVLARITGLGDDYLLPKTESLAHTIIGNGIPVQLTQGVIAPLLNKDDLSGRNVLARLGKSIFKNDWDADKQKKVSDQVVNTANKLGGAEATVYTSVDEVPDAYLSDVKNGATGWYDPTTHTVHVYLPNCADANEAERTVLHEKIGHEGMEVLLGGEDEVRKFANFVYNSVAASTRGKILEIANEYDPDWKKHDRMNVGTQEYIARLAEEGPKTAEDFSLWTKIKHYLIKVLKKLGIRVPGLLNDKDLRYYLMKAGKALHVWDEMPQEKQEAMMKQASNAEIKDSLGEGAGKGKPRQKKGESAIQFIKRAREWERWKEAREDENDPEPPMFYDFDKDAEGKKEWERLNKEWRDSHHLQGDEMPIKPERKEGETDEAFFSRYKEWEKWNDAMADKENPMPDMFSFEKAKQDEARQKYEDWLTKHELNEQNNADLDLYEGKIYPAETNPKADDLEQQVMQDLAEVTSTDVSKEGAARSVHDAVIYRRKNIESASADDAIFINSVKQELNKMANASYLGRKADAIADAVKETVTGKSPKTQAKKMAEAIPYIIEAPRRMRDIADEMNAVGAFENGHIHVTAKDIDAIQPFTDELRVLASKSHKIEKDGKETIVYDDVPSMTEVASKMAKAINDNHVGEEGFVPVDGTDILAEHVLPVVLKRIVPEGVEYKNLSEEMQALLDKIREWYDKTFTWLKDSHTVREDIGYTNDYVNHRWDKEKSDDKAYADLVEGRQRTKSPNEKPRKVSTYMEGVDAGLVPKTTDITDLLGYYSQSNIEAFANKTFLQELSGINVIERNKDGEITSSMPLLSSIQPKEMMVDENKYTPYVVPGINTVWVYNQGKIFNKSAEDWFNAAFGTVKLSKTLKGIKNAMSIAKTLELGFSGFHAGALTEVYAVQNSAEFGPAKAMAYFMKYLIADTAKNHQLPAFANPDVFKEAAKHLVKFGSTSDYATADIENLYDKVHSYVSKLHSKLVEGNVAMKAGSSVTFPLEVATELLRMSQKGLDVALWSYLHDGLKLATYQLRAERTSERAKKLDWDEDMLNKALDEDGQFVNDMFGGQHFDVLGISKKMQTILDFIFLSKDWLISTTRHALSIFGYGSIWNEASIKNFMEYYKHVLGRGEMTKEDYLRLSRSKSGLLCYGIGFMIGYEGLSQLVNAAMRAWDEEKQKEKADEIRKTNPSYKSPYELAYPNGMHWYDYLMRGNSLGQQSKIFMGRYADGTEMYIRHGKQFREIPELFFDAKDNFAIPGPMVRRMYGKASPLLRGMIDTYKWYLSPDYGDKKMQRKYGENLGLIPKLGSYYVPFAVPTQKDKEFKMLDLVFPSSKGFSRYKAQDYFKTFIMSEDKQGLAMTYNACVQNGIDPEVQLKAAISSVKALEASEMSDGVTSLQEASKRFDAAKSITEKKKMRQKMKKFLSQSDYKAFTQKEALDMVQGYLNGDEDLKEMEKAESKYLMAAKAEDVTEDWRIQNVWNGTMETYQEYQRLKDIDKAKANAFKNSKTNKRLFAARKAISAAKKKMNKAKKQMDGTNDAAKLVEIRNTRKELLKTLNGME